MKSETDAVLILGAGIGGIKAAFDVAELGQRVFLVDENPFLGGTLSQLDRQFPTNRCCMCQLLPTVARHGTTHYCLRRELYHPNITAIPGSQLTELTGAVGNFKATITTRAVEVDPELCTNCGACVDVCPVEVQDEFNGFLTSRKAIYAKYPLPIPNIYVIDRANCTRCGACVDICPTDAINLNKSEKIHELNVGSIILSAGFEEFNPHILMQYGHGRYPDVLTSVELERMFSGYGAGKGDIFRPSDGTTPQSIAFIQCVGSRDHEREYCSAACCMYALKEAMIIREEHPDLPIHFFYMDARAYGKGYHRYLEKARDQFKITFTRSRIPVVKENPATKKLILKYLTETGDTEAEEFDLVVLSIGQVPPSYNEKLSQLLGLPLNQWGFCATDEFMQTTTSNPGIFVCGAFSEPKDIPETIAQASTAALNAVSVLRKHSSKTAKTNTQTETTPNLWTLYDAKSEERDWENKTAIFICQCGGEITRLLDLNALANFSKKLPNVHLCEKIDVLCSATSLKKVSQRLREIKVSRVVFAACVPYHYQHLFEEAAMEAGIAPGYVKIVNIREHAAWPHADDQSKATEKAKNMIAMGVEFARQESALETARPDSVISRALIIGGGTAGMSAALGLADLGIPVDLVEMTDQLGGQLKKIHFAPHQKDPQELLQQLIKLVQENNLIKIHFNTSIRRVQGQAGKFQVEFQNEQIPEMADYGAIIVATGGEEHLPTTFGYGQNERILTQQKFKEKVVAGEIDLAKVNQVVMIQCVESRTAERPYCSRICCTQAVTNALKIKELNPAAEIIVFNRDIMTYGFREQYYSQARESGVLFVRYEEAQPPEVSIEGNRIQVKAVDPVLNEELIFEPDLLLLSTGIDPQKNHELAEILNVPLDEEGFFQEAEVKFRPVDFHKDGIYVAGLAHSPRFIEETVTQGFAAAARAATILTKEKLPASPLVAEVNQRRCSGCQMCISACVYDARVWDEDSHTVLVREAICQGCGACTMVCPNNACRLKGYRDKQVMAVIDQAFIAY